MDYTLECERDADGRWLAEVPQLIGVLAYGATREEALRRAEALALHVLAERLEQRKACAQSIHIVVPDRSGFSADESWPEAGARASVS